MTLCRPTASDKSFENKNDLTNWGDTTPDRWGGTPRVRHCARRVVQTGNFPRGSFSNDIAVNSNSRFWRTRVR